MTETRDSLLMKIPKTNKGRPKNIRLKHLQKVLLWERLSQTDFDFISKEIDFYIQSEKIEKA